MGKALGTVLLVLGLLIALATGLLIVFALQMAARPEYELNMANFPIVVVICIIGYAMFIGGIILRMKS